MSFQSIPQNFTRPNPIHGSTVLLRILAGGLLAVSLSLTACKHQDPPKTTELDQAGMEFSSVAQLQTLNVSNAEIGELAIARHAGLSDETCIELIKLARSRQKPFADGQSIANLLAAGMSEQAAVELARLNQLGLWSGEAQAMRLAGLSDKIIVVVAQRKAMGLPVLSGTKLAELKNAGVGDAAILDMVQRGVSESEASYYITSRTNAAGGHGFVYQRRGRRH